MARERGTLARAVAQNAGTLDDAVLPDFGGACIASVVPALLGREDHVAPAWLPSSLAEADQVVLLVVDGLGALQLEARAALTPVLSSMQRSVLTSVAPSTTAVALTSFATGLVPAEHGIFGYRVAEGDAVLNVLRWRVGDRDVRGEITPDSYQRQLPFLGRPVPVVSRSDFVGSGFTEAHLRGAPWSGWSVASSIAVEVGRLLRAGEPFVYAYYDGLDKVAHERGLDAHYDAELAYVDRLVGELRAVLPAGAALAVSADHGEMEVDRAPVDLLSAMTVTPRLLSGEGRFRWVHLAPEDVEEGLQSLRERLGSLAWVNSRDELIEHGLFGGTPSAQHAARLGEIAVIAREPVSFSDPADPGEQKLVGRHGSLTASEMLVPLLGCRS